MKNGMKDKGTTVFNSNQYHEDSEHWTKKSIADKPVNQDMIDEPYRPEIMSQEWPESAAIFMKEQYSRLSDMPFASAIAEFAGLYQLMRHNPHFNPEANALRNMIEGEIVLHQMASKVERI